MPTTPAHGLLVLDKPGGMTSRDALNRVQRWFPRGTKLGHTGTLDPLATGVLVVCVGAATRLAEYVQRMDKVYLTTIALDRRSTTDDRDGDVEPVPFPEPHPDRAAVEQCVQSFVGELAQVPPAFSAAKVAGRRAYALARAGEAVTLAPRHVRIYGIDLLHYTWPTLKLRVHCGKGTYIRSLARDLGTRLGRAGMVETLRRTRVGSFEEAHALSLDVAPTTAQARLLPLAEAVADLPRVTLRAEEIARLRKGQVVALPASALLSCSVTTSEDVAVFDLAGTLTAVATVDPCRRTLVPTKVLP